MAQKETDIPEDDDKKTMTYQELENDPDMDFPEGDLPEIPEDEEEPAQAVEKKEVEEDPIEDDEGEEETDPDITIKTLKKQIVDKEAERVAAVDAKDKAEKEAKDKGAASIEQQIALTETKIETALNTKTAEIKDVKAKLQAALDEGEHATVVDLQEQLGILTGELVGIKGFKSNFEAQKEKWEESRKAEPVETEGQYTSEAQKWIDARPQFQTNPDGTPKNEYTAVAIGAHNRAMVKNIKADSPEYFKFVEEALQKEGFEEGKASSKKDPPPRKAQSRQTTAAPSGDRGGGEPSGAKGRASSGAKTLTADERWAAKNSDMSDEEYWDEKYGKGAKKS